MEAKKTNNNSLAIKIIVGVAAAILLFIIWLIFINKNNQPDERVFTFFAFRVTVPLTNIMKAITFLGDHNFLIPANLFTMAFLLFKKNKEDALRFLVVALTSVGLMSLLKYLFHRHRPINPLIEGITNFSFPSGHAFMSLTFFGLLIYFIATEWKKNWLTLLLIFMLLLLIFFIGFSRVYLRVHYTSDVIAGWIFGSFWLLICLFVLDKLLKKKPATLQEISK